jgi:threonine synthase
MKSFIKNLFCPKCGKTFSYERIVNLCECGSPLLVGYDIERARAEVEKSSLRDRTNDLWRYAELLPVVDERNMSFWKNH